MTAKNVSPGFPWPALLSAGDGLGIFAWGLLFLKYSSAGQLQLLVHPNYFALVTVTGFVLLALGSLRLYQSLQRLWKYRHQQNYPETVTHLTVLPLGLGSTLLLITAIAGFLIPPTVFTSQMALQRGISNTLPATQMETASFKAPSQPQERSLVDWIRLLNAYPEPDAYQGQKAKVTGFVVYPPGLNDTYLLISRFILTCCAVDVYPVGLPVKLAGPRSQYPQDIWLEVEGQMITETLPLNTQIQPGQAAEKRQLVLEAQSIKAIPTPADPYSY